MILLPLFSSLLYAQLSFDLILDKIKGNPLHLISESRNITLDLNGNTLYADNVAICPVEVGKKVNQPRN